MPLPDEDDAEGPFDVVATVPINDLIEHDDFSEDCVCGPDAESVAREDGTFGWTIVHHSLDGRELTEQEPGEAGS